LRVNRPLGSSRRDLAARSARTNLDPSSREAGIADADANAIKSTLNHRAQAIAKERSSLNKSRIGSMKFRLRESE